MLRGRFFIEERPVSPLKVDSASFHIIEVGTNEYLSLRFVIPIRIMILVPAKRSDEGADETGHSRRNGNLVAERERINGSVFGVSPFRVFWFTEFRPSSLLIEVESNGYLYTTVGARKGMRLRVFVPNLRAGDYLRITRNALGDSSDSHGAVIVIQPSGRDWLTG
jgi:hypothetical protein